MDIFNITNNMNYDFEKSIVDYKNIRVPIYAHPQELLFNHGQKTYKIFNSLIDENILSYFFNFFSDNNLINIGYIEFKKIIKQCIHYHDIGKVSFSFQINRLNRNTDNSLNDEGFIQKELFTKIFGDFNELSYFDENHSSSGAYVFLNYLDNKYKLKKNLLLLVFVLVIAGHHTKILDFNKFNLKNDNTICFICELLEDNIYKNQIEYNDKNGSRIDDLNKYFKKFDKKYNNETMYYLSSFYQYIYSLLITSDVIASSQYEYNQITVEKNNNRITDDLLIKMYNKFNEFNKTLNIEKPINKLRHEMLVESSENLLKALNDDENNRIFYLNMPTGAGKTNTSMKLALDILKNTDADRIFYTMPFITILDQNYDIICENFDLEDNKNIRKLCSTNSFIFNNDEEFKNDDEKMEYLSEILMNDDFLDYPVICTTFVRLFNTIIRNNKRNKYGFASLSNSVVILDEVQSLPIKNWSSLYYILNDISEKLNIYFIFMSATLPEFKKLDEKYQNYNYVPLIENPQKYYDSSIFKDRTKIMGLATELDIDDIESLKEYFYQIINNNFQDDYFKGLIVLNTVKSSKLVYDLVKEFQEELDFEVDLLNSTIMSHKKKELIDKIEDMTNKRYILVSTQSIEAGVDVSFSFVIRDFTTLDSIEQIRGRCNRHNELPESNYGKIYLIKLLDDKNKELFSYIYNKEEIETRITETKKLIIDKANIDYSFNDLKKYYENISKIKYEITTDKEKKLESNDNDNIQSWNRMLYSKLNNDNGIHIIEDKKQVTLFLMIDIDITHFKEEELDYLKNIEKDLDYNLIEYDKVIAENILSYYDFDQMKDVTDYKKKKIIKKEFSSILDKFLINTYVNDELRAEYQTLESYKKYYKDYFFFEVIPNELIGEGDDCLYSVKTGLNHDYKYFKDFGSKCC